MPRWLMIELCIAMIWVSGITGRISAQDTCPSSAHDGVYLKLASWNIRIFSNARSDDELKMICRVAKNFDFIAVLELKDEAVLKRMVAMLQSEFGRTYAYDLSPYVGYGAKDDEALGAKELYAFLYDTSMLTCIKKGVVYDDSLFYRKPYYATFKTGSFDFTVVVIHVIWGDTVSQRRKEINRLAQVYRNVQDGDLTENDVILLGDFNRDPNDDLAWAPLYSISSMIHLFDLPEKSMIWDTHLYDNILFQSNYVSEYNLDKGIIRFDETDFGNDDEAASLAVSDHRPVWGLFWTAGPDDD